MPDHPLTRYLDADEAALAERWQRLEAWIEARFGEAPSIEKILFLVGVQVRGRGFQPDLDKDAKQSLIMEGTYGVFETLGVYRRVGMETDDAWIWERLLEPPPGLSVDQQEKLLKTAILHYFDDVFSLFDDA